MTDIRQIDIPEKDLPLRADVSLLGSLVGDVLVDQHGRELFEHVEEIRKAAIINREGRGDEASLDRALSRLDDGQVIRVIQAFASYLRAVNLAEKIHRIRRSRAYQRAEAGAQRGSLEAALRELKEQGIDADTMASEVNALRIQPVFTAHPTEATRRTIQEK